MSVTADPARFPSLLVRQSPIVCALMPYTYVQLEELQEYAPSVMALGSKTVCRTLLVQRVLFLFHPILP